MRGRVNWTRLLRDDFHVSPSCDKPGPLALWIHEEEEEEVMVRVAGQMTWSLGTWLPGGVNYRQGSGAHHTYIQARINISHCIETCLMWWLGQKFERTKVRLFQQFELLSARTYVLIPFDQWGSKWIFKTGNGIIQTGKRIIPPTSRPLMKKVFFTKLSSSWPVQCQSNWKLRLVL